MSTNTETMALRVKSCRKAAGMTQHQLAAKSGLKQPDISKIELGLIEKTTGIARLADALGVSAKWLESGKGPQTKIAEQLVGGDAPRVPPRDFSDRREVSESDWATLQDVKLVMMENELDEVRKRAAHIRRQQEVALTDLLARKGGADA